MDDRERYRDALAQYLVSEKDTRPYWETDHRGMVLPLVKSGYNNSVSYGVPGIAGGSAWGVLNDIISGRQVAKGEIEQGASDAAGAAMTGSLAMTRPSGSIGSGGRLANELPMDQASRMARAKEMGFDTDTTWYRGRAGDAPLEEFQTARQGYRFGDKHGGIHLSSSRNVGQWYADHHAQRNMTDALKAERERPLTLYERLFGREIAPMHPTGQEVLDLYVNPGRQAVIDLSGREDMNGVFIRDQIAKHKGNGYDSVLVRQTPDALVKDEAGKYADELIVFDPKNIRRRQAAFDPAMANSANLLAANAPTSAASPSLQHIAKTVSQDSNGRSLFRDGEYPGLDGLFAAMKREGLKGGKPYAADVDLSKVRPLQPPSDIEASRLAKYVSEPVPRDVNVSPDTGIWLYKDQGGNYYTLDGHHRAEAARQRGDATLPAYIRDLISKNEISANAPTAAASPLINYLLQYDERNR